MQETSFYTIQLPTGSLGYLFRDIRKFQNFDFFRFFDYGILGDSSHKSKFCAGVLQSNLVFLTHEFLRLMSSIPASRICCTVE